MELGSPEFWEQLEADPRRLAVEVCRIDLVALETTLQQHPALRAWVNAAYEVARIEEDTKKWELTKGRARAYQAAREGGTKKTGATIEAEVELNEDVIALTADLLGHQRKSRALRAIVNALDDRRDMVIQLAAKQRKEMSDYQS